MFDKYLTKTGRLSCNQPQEIKNLWYIQKFQEVHGDRYDYSKVCYLSRDVKIEVICKIHGSYFQTTSSHVAGKGCPSCQGNSKKDTKQCVEDFISVHGYVYDYSRVHYTYNKEKVEIICKQHGSFFQSPNTHLNGHGCPKCQYDNQDTLYVLKCLDTGLTKIGITNNLQQRISTIGGNLEHICHINLENPRALEKELHKRYKEQQVFNYNVRSGGTEFFRLSDQQVEELVCFLSQHQDQ